MSEGRGSRSLTSLFSLKLAATAERCVRPRDGRRRNSDYSPTAILPNMTNNIEKHQKELSGSHDLEQNWHFTIASPSLALQFERGIRSLRLAFSLAAPVRCSISGIGYVR